MTRKVARRSGQPSTATARVNACGRDRVQRCLRGIECILGGESDAETVATTRGCELEGTAVLGGALVLAGVEVARARLALLRDDRPEHEVVA